MKRTLMLLAIVEMSYTAHAQISKDAQIKPATAPVYNPFQLPNYYQNNSSYSNNSMQNNRPVLPNAYSFPGNGNYVDPSRNPGSNTTPLPGTAPLNTPNNNNAVNTPASSR